METVSIRVPYDLLVRIDRSARISGKHRTEWLRDTLDANAGPALRETTVDREEAEQKELADSFGIDAQAIEVTLANAQAIDPRITYWDKLFFNAGRPGWDLYLAKEMKARGVRLGGDVNFLAMSDQERLAWLNKNFPSNE